MRTFKQLTESIPKVGSICHRILPNGGVSRIKLHSPETRNALSPSMMLELGEAVAKSREAPFIIVTGTPTAFCSGANITLAAEQLMSTEGGVAMNKLMTEA